MAAHPGHLRRLCAATCTDAFGCCVWNNGVHLPFDCDCHFRHSENTKTMENSKYMLHMIMVPLILGNLGAYIIMRVNIIIYSYELHTPGVARIRI